MTTAPRTGPTPPQSQAALARTLARHPRPAGGDPMRRTDKPLVSLSGLVINNQQEPQQLASKRKPKWLKAKVPGGPGYDRLRGIMDEHKLHTVCEEAGCPNMGECWARGVSTLNIWEESPSKILPQPNEKTMSPTKANLFFLKK